MSRVIHIISMRSLIFLFFGLMLLYSEKAWSQTDTEFWFAAPDINVDHSDRPVFIRMTSLNLPTVVTISQPANPSFPIQSFILPPFTTQSVDLTPYINMIECKPGNSVLNYGIHIKATKAITAYYEVVSNNNNPEIFALKGRNSIGTEFLTPFQNFAPSAIPLYSIDYQNGFIIVATTDNTTVTITPSQNAIGHPAGVPFVITLNKGQTFALVAASNLANGRMCGSSIVSDKPIAVTVYDDSVSGVWWGGTCADLCGDQIIPVAVTGKEYIVIRGWLGNNTEKIYIVGTQDNTEIFVAGNATPVATINTGQTFSYDLVTNSLYVKTSKPVYLSHLSGFGCELGMPILPPIDCTGSRTLGFTRSIGHFFGVILLVKDGHQGNFILNGSTTAIDPSEFTVVPGTAGEWVAARIDLTGNCPVNTGSRITNTTALFHLGIFNGNNFSGCRYGYFSDFSNLYLGSDILKCPLDSVTLDAGYGKYSYLWSTGETTQEITVQDPGTYWVVADNGDCYVSDTINIANNYLPVLNLGNDTALCAGNSVPINAGNAFLTYLWSNGDTTSQILVNQSNTYTVTVSDNICIDSASKKVIFMNAHILNNDTSVCEGVTVTLTAIATGDVVDKCTYLWSTGDTTAVIQVNPTTNTTYTVTVSCLNTHCTDQVTVSVVDGAFTVGPDTTLCSGTPYTINGPPGSAPYIWSTSATGQSITVTEPGLYWLEANSTQGCQFRDTIIVNFRPIPVDLGDVIFPSVNGLIARYPFDYNLVDSGGYFNNGVNHGVTFVPDHLGVSGKAANFGGNAYISVSNSPSLQSPQQGFSMMGWVKVDNLTGGNGSILCKSDESSLSPYQYRLGFQTNNAYFGFKNSASTVVNYTTSYSIPLFQWNYAGFTYDGQFVRYYINQNLIGQVSATSPIFQDSKDLFIGRDAYGVDEYFKGALDDLRLYNRPLCRYEMSLVTLPRTMTLSTSQTVICSGDSVTVQLHYPQPGISYQLYSFPANVPAGPAQITLCDSVMTFSTGSLTISNKFRILALDTLYGCQRWLSGMLNITVKPTPEVNILPLNPVMCKGDSINLTATSTLGSTGFTWSTGAGSATILVHPVSDSLFFVRGELNGCIDSAEVLVQVKPVPLAQIIPADTSICKGENVVLTAQSNLPLSSFSWSSGGGTAAISVAPLLTTTYVVTVSLDGCSDTAHRKVIVKPIPEIGFTNPNPEVCAHDSVMLNAYSNLTSPSWQWENGPSTATWKLAAIQNAWYVVQCTVEQCMAEDSVYVMVNPSPVLLITTNSPAICLGDSTTLLASSTLPGTVFTWSNGSNGSVLKVSPFTNTVYSVSGVFDGCTGSDTITIQVKPVPVAGINPSDTSVCRGDSFTLRGSSSLAGSNYSWSSGSNQPNIYLTPQHPAIYTLIVDADGCRDTVMSTVHVIAIPEVSLGPDRYLCDGAVEWLRISQGYSDYSWSDGSKEHMLYVHEPGEYWVVVRNQTCPATDTVLLKECSELWIPNAFTPDDNGVNDVFLPKGVEIVKYEMLIFNRWGEHLFTSNVLEVGWDGVYNGEKAKSDVYYYMIRFTGQGRPGSDKEQVRYGPFTLVR